VRLLGLHEIHIWCLNTDVDATTLASLSSTLSAAEHLQARRFHFAIDAQRFVARRGLVRATLASYLAIVPGKLTFSNRAHGKPMLSADITSRLHFNYSFSDQLLLLAVSNDYEVGIDIEVTRQVPEVRQIAAQNFSVAEQQALAHKHYAPDTFFSCWTAKEAVIKALGTGLSRPLHDFSTLTENGSMQHELHVHDEHRAEMQRIRLFALSTPSQSHATLAVLLPVGAAEPQVLLQTSSSRN
jgi:4'-phosphopantetheinyl transferase